MPTKTGLTRPRAGLGLASNVPASTVQKRKVTSAAVKSTKPKPNTVGRRTKP